MNDIYGSSDERQAALHEQDLQRLRGFRLMDDDFLSAFFRDNIEDTEFILRIILNKPTLQVKSVHAQHELKNLNGRSVRLDVHAVEDNGTEIDIEVQRDDRGAGFKRARHNSSLLDASILKPGQKPEELPETYVIFITESDVIGLDEPIYPIERYIFVQGKYIPVDDGAHTIYVNGAKQGNETELEKLMHDFSCIKAEDMYYSQLAKKMRYLKEDEKGVEAMCRVMEEMRDETELATRIENALEMISDGQLSLEKIAQYAGLPLDKVRELAENKSA
ncbi:MAG: PD-(D/E)XK nuclease family transposase [Clostridiales bacterium]|nr:PD-(D/E)XK nuclease family transposase [Clostridiales bacterium]